MPIPTIETLANQIMQSNGLIKSTRAETGSMSFEINRLQRRGPDDRERKLQRDRRDDDFIDRKFFTPEPFGVCSIFREWKIEFADWFAGRDAELADKPERAEKASETVICLDKTERARENLTGSSASSWFGRKARARLGTSCTIIIGRAGDC